MKNVLFLFILTALYVTSFAQDNIRPSCRNHKATMHRHQPSAEELARMESMAFRSDTFDIIHYSIHLNSIDYVLKQIHAQTDIYFSARMEGQNSLHLDLLNLQVDSIKSEGEHLDFTYDSLMVHVSFEADLNPADTNMISIYYGGHPTIDPSGFGGFDFQDGYSYNLGIGLASIPHNFGRGWFPCFDNFVERSTYEFFVTTINTQFAYCTGTHESTTDIGNNKLLYHYHMKQPITTYQAAVAIADYEVVSSFHEGIEKEIPIELVSKAQDTTAFKNSFAYLTEAIEALEQWYGPYQWERVGYVITTRGAMEHPTCVAYPASLGLNGNAFNNMDIMSHELAHHWFGNYTTLTTAYDMWVKEGTSEYGYHLFTKEFLGDEEFHDLIASNQYDVIETAHIVDDGFRALSGMPFEYTYGTTTYQKGAAVIHNMHSYLGDSLFKAGMRAVLDEFAYSHCDATDFEATLSDATGVDMAPFFKDWILAPGFSAFEIDSMQYYQNGTTYEVDLFIEQKLYHSPHYHTKVPMRVTFYDGNWEPHHHIIELDGQYSEVGLSLEFEPILAVLNQDNFLNNGQLSYTRVINENDKYKFKRAKLDVTVEMENETDSLLLFVEHIWGAPDPIQNEDVEVTLSTNHYWVIDGVKPEDANLTTRFYYEGQHEDNLDHELAGESEEDMLLLYRADQSQDWGIYPYATKNAFIPTDGKGSFIVDSLLFGQYCFASGDFGIDTKDIPEDLDLVRIKPNPTSQQVEVSLIQFSADTYQVLNALGQEISGSSVEHNRFNIDLGIVESGIYYIRLIDSKNNMVKTRRVIKL